VRFRFRFTDEGRARARFVDDWWRANRPDAPDLFVDELEAAIARMLVAP
jgi:hypothetical protein